MPATQTDIRTLLESVSADTTSARRAVRRLNTLIPLAGYGWTLEALADLQEAYGFERNDL